MKDPAQLLDVQDWYASDIPRKELKTFMKKSNFHGLIYIGGWLIMLGVSGYLAYRLIGTFWAIPAFFLYGVIYSSCNAKWHECSHGSVFKMNWLNDFFYFLCGAMEFRDPVDFTWSHSRHHSYTLRTNVDPEIVSPRPPKIFDIILEFFAIKSLLIAIKTLVLHSFKIPTQNTRDYIPENEYGKMAWGARAVLSLHLIAIGLSFWTQSWLPVLYFTFARCYGAFFQWTFIMTQHVGRQENVWDHRSCARSMKVNPFLSFLLMNMENHIEHHIYPMVPFHALPKLRKRIGDQLPRQYTSMIDGIREVIQSVFKQLKDPNYSAIQPLPENALSE